MNDIPIILFDYIKKRGQSNYIKLPKKDFRKVNYTKYYRIELKIHEVD